VTFDDSVDARLTGTVNEPPSCSANDCDCPLTLNATYRCAVTGLNLPAFNLAMMNARLSLTEETLVRTQRDVVISLCFHRLIERRCCYCTWHAGGVSHVQTARSFPGWTVPRSSRALRSVLIALTDTDVPEVVFLTSGLIGAFRCVAQTASANATARSSISL